MSMYIRCFVSISPWILAFTPERGTKWEWVHVKVRPNLCKLQVETCCSTADTFQNGFTLNTVQVLFQVWKRKITKQKARKKRLKKKTPTYSLRASRHMDLHHRCRLQLLWLHGKLVTRCLVFINRINKNPYTLSRILEIWRIICHSSSRRQFLEGMMKNNERGVCCQCQEQTTISNLFSESSLCKTKGV